MIQSLAHTIGLESDSILLFDQLRKKRNIGDYERAGMVSDQEATEMFELAKDIRAEVETWLNTHHPDLLK